MVIRFYHLLQENTPQRFHTLNRCEVSTGKTLLKKIILERQVLWGKPLSKKFSKLIQKVPQISMISLMSLLT